MIDIPTLRKAGLSDAQILKVLEEDQLRRREMNRKHQQNHRLRKADRTDKADTPDSVDKQLFRRGDEVLGKRSGGLVSRLLTAHGGDFAACLRIIEAAAKTDNPRNYVAGCCKAKPMTLKERRAQENADAYRALCEYADANGHDEGPGGEVIEGTFSFVSDAQPARSQRLHGKSD